MIPFRIRITMGDGSRGEHFGLYAHGFDAYDKAVDLFPQARSVSVRCLLRGDAA